MWWAAYFAAPEVVYKGGTGVLQHAVFDTASGVEGYAAWRFQARRDVSIADHLAGRSGQQRGSAMGAHYRHTTPEMAARVIAAVQQRLTVVLQMAEQALENSPNRSTLRVF